MSVTLHWVGAQTISTVETTGVRVYNLNRVSWQTFRREAPMFGV